MRKVSILLFFTANFVLSFTNAFSNVVSSISIASGTTASLRAKIYMNGRSIGPHSRAFYCGIRQICNEKYINSLKMSSLGDEGKKENQTNKWRRLGGKMNPVKPILFSLNKANKMRSNFVKKFKSLSKKGKLLFSIQLLTLVLIFGSGTKKVISNVRGKSATTKVSVSKPVEVPYSVFMDFVEKSGKVRNTSGF